MGTVEASFVLQVKGRKWIIRINWWNIRILFLLFRVGRSILIKHLQNQSLIKGNSTLAEVLKMIFFDSKSQTTILLCASPVTIRDLVGWISTDTNSAMLYIIRTHYEEKKIR